MALTPTLVLLNHAVQQLAILLKFHFHMDFACQTHIGQQLVNHGLHLQMQHPAARAWCHLPVEQVTILQMEHLKVVLFQNWFQTNGCLFLLSWAHWSFFNKTCFEVEIYQSRLVYIFEYMQCIHIFEFIIQLFQYG